MKAKVFYAAIVSAMVLMAFVGTASATTLEVGGSARNEAVTIEATLFSGGSSLLTDTAGTTANTCTTSTVKGTTVSPFSGTTVGGPISTLSWSTCTQGTPVVEKNEKGETETGTLSVENITGTTSGTVRSSGAKVTVPSVFGTLTCTTSNTDIGKLTGVSSGSTTLDINAVLSCTVIGSAKWSGTYVVTSPAGLGVRS